MWRDVREQWIASTVVASLAVALSAQTAKPTFEVASVKKRDPAAPVVRAGTGQQPAAFYRPRTTVASLISFAYNIPDAQLVGGPDWIREDLFEINARAARESSDEEKRPMVQSLLEDRFRLIAHTEQRRMRFAALVVARSNGKAGPGLTQCGDTNAPTAPADLGADSPRVVWPRGGRLSILRCVPMSAVANLAAGNLRLPVVDRTGLTGLWSLVLTHANPQPTTFGVGADSADDPDLSSFSEALQDQLGLKAESNVGLVDVLVVDSVQQPTEN